MGVGPVGRGGSPAIEALHSVMRGVVRAGEPLAKHTTMRIGGPARLFALPAREEDVARCLAWAKEAGQPWCVIGLGSNLLCPDDGFPGVVISLEDACVGWSLTEASLHVGAGTHLVPLINEAARRGLAGLEGVAGVPGTVGGALTMNAGTPSGDIAAVVRHVRVLAPGGEVEVWDRAQMGFAYRSSRLQQGRWVALGAELALRPADPGGLLRDLRERAMQRRRTQPLELPNAGSIWRNPPGDHAGRLVEAAGCRGWRVGDAQVSPRHGNFIVNLGHAQARDVIALMAAVRAEVAGRFGVHLHPELRWLYGQEGLEALLDRPPPEDHAAFKG